MLSGIGPADHLKALGIPVVADVAGRRAEPPGSPQAVDPLERHDRAAGFDGHRGHVHALDRSRRWARPARPAVLRRARARDAGSIRHHHRLAGAAASRAARSGCARPIRWRRRSSAATTCRSRQTSMRWCRASSSRAGSAKLTRTSRCGRTRSSRGRPQKSDADLATFARRAADTIYHPRRHVQDGAGQRRCGRRRSQSCASAASTACASPTRRSCRRS